MGFIFNRSAKGKPNWWGAFQDIDGKRKRARTGARTKADAYQVLSTWETRVAQGLPGLPTKGEKEEVAARARAAQAAQRVTVGDLIKEWRAKYTRPKIKNRSRYMTTYGGYAGLVEARPIASMPAAKVRRPDVEELRDDLTAAGYSPGTIKQVVSVLGRIYEWAMDREMIPALRSPCKGVELAEVRPAEDYYTADELVKLLDYTEANAPELYPMIAVGTYAGLRPGELASLVWDCVDLDASPPRIEVKRSWHTTPKGGKPRTVPMHPELVPILRAWRERCPETPEGLCFPVKGGEGWRMLFSNETVLTADILKASGCHVPVERSRVGQKRHERTLHTLRHSTATLPHEAGVSGEVISGILGHASGSRVAAVTKGYIHTAPLAYLASELSKWVLRPRPAATPAPADVQTPVQPEHAQPEQPEGEGGKLISLAAERERRERQRRGAA